MGRFKDIMTEVGMLAAVVSSSVIADDEIDVPLGEVPAEVLTAVRNARPDIRIHSAAHIVRESGILYEIEGDAGDAELEFVVTPDGRILETEKE